MSRAAQFLSNFANEAGSVREEFFWLSMYLSKKSDDCRCVNEVDRLNILRNDLTPADIVEMESAKKQLSDMLEQLLRSVETRGGW